MERIFVTGASGYLGSRLLRRMLTQGYDLVGLSRSELSHEGGSGTLEPVRADLFEPANYREALATAQTVVHLAAANGSTPAKEVHRVNVLGTELLLDECRRAGVRNFLLVSSISVRLPCGVHYPYARAKADAEELVRSSGLSYAIVRPTLIVGPGAPLLTGLAKLAMLPLMPVFGSGRALVQPIFVDDVVDFLLALLQRCELDGLTVELGGPEVLPVERLLRAIRRRLGHGTGPCIHVPIEALAFVLSAAEALGFPLLPLTAGQLSSFRWDATATTDGIFQTYFRHLKGIDEMLRLTFSA